MASVRLDRQVQAQRELGATAVGRGSARLLTLAFLATVSSVPAIDLVGFAGRDSGRATAGEVGAGLTELAAGRPLSANRRLLRALHGVERKVEEESIVRRWGLAPLQWVLTRGLGVGNEQAYLGRGHWLFYRADVDHVMGPGFLEPAWLESRRLGGEAWEPPVEPDPLPALVGLGKDLEARGIDLVLLPVPVKPSVHPEHFSRRAAGLREPIRNPSFGAFVSAVEREGIEVIDPAPELAAGGTEPSYLRADTHWTPEAMERVAARVAERLGPRLGEPGAGPSDAPGPFTRESAVVAGQGDIAVMLRLPEWAGIYVPQPVEIHPVRIGGRPWQADEKAELLLLGDSFTNMYSDPALGWGGAAGLAEQISYALGRPLDRIARNAGGAKGARAVLARSPDRLAGKRLVLYQFAARDLSQGDWPVLPLPPAEP